MEARKTIRSEAETLLYRYSLYGCYSNGHTGGQAAMGRETRATPLRRPVIRDGQSLRNQARGAAECMERDARRGRRTSRRVRMLMLIFLGGTTR